MIFQEVAISVTIGVGPPRVDLTAKGEIGIARAFTES
jgi:hypothetical protein